MPEDMSDRMPEDMPDRMPEDLPDRMPEDMAEDLPDRMPEDMPEDLPVRKCINVMVVITRSKVILQIGGQNRIRIECVHLWGLHDKLCRCKWANFLNQSLRSISGHLTQASRS